MGCTKRNDVGWVALWQHITPPNRSLRQPLQRLIEGNSHLNRYAMQALGKRPAFDV
jgi:hypothetical protein